MNKLISANFAGLWKNKYFWICLGAMFAYIVLYMISRCQIVRMDLTDQETNLETYYFEFSLVIGLFCAVFSPLYLSREYTSGAIRNKIIAGHSRKSIYLSLLVSVFAASLLMLLAGMAGGLVGVPVLGFWEMDGTKLLIYLLITVMYTLTFCAINTYINMLSPNRVFGALLSLLVFLAMFFLIAKVEERLFAPTTVFSDISISGSEVNFADPMPNPRYVSGVKRDILDFIVDFLPAGQSERVAYLWVEHPVRMLLSSIFLTISVTFWGIFRFERKDLK